jgi:hypothetical protein
LRLHRCSRGSWCGIRRICEWRGINFMRLHHAVGSDTEASTPALGRPSFAMQSQ